MSTDCIFCKIINNEFNATKVYEDSSLIVIMDVFPESRGHMLIIPKAHHTNLYTVEDELLAKIIATSKKIAEAAVKALNADGIRIAQFNGEAAGQTVFHYHMHVIPAYEGVPFKKHSGEPAAAEQLQQLAKLIQDNLHG